MDRKYMVLAVDDSAFTLTIISTYLDSSEFQIVGTARSGMEALERYQEVEPDLVLMDLVMPGWSGQETLRRLLELKPDAKVVMISSLGTEDAVAECLQIGAKSFLQKPFKKDDLLGFLREVVTPGQEGATP